MADKKIIEELNPVISHYSGDIQTLKPILSYREEVWSTDLNYSYPRKKNSVVTRYLIGNKGIFLTGFIPKVTDYLKYEKIPFTYKKYISDMKISITEPILNGITFYKWQQRALSIMIPAKRGVWIAPTAAGKTILFIALMKAIDTNSLVLVHTKSLFSQTYEELHTFFPKEEIGCIGDGKKELKKYNVGMVQTVANLKIDFKNYFGLIIIDEVHHATTLPKGKSAGMYAQVLQKTYAPYRFGVTATIPPQEDKKLILEGLVGPILGEATYPELIENGLIATPKMKFILVPPNKFLSNLKGKYLDVYKKGIVQNRIRNQLIIKEAKKYIQEGKSVLILVERIEHGNELSKFAEIEFPKNSFIFIHGKTDTEVFEKVKKAKRKWLSLKKEKEGYFLELGYKKKEIKQTMEKDKQIILAEKTISKKEKDAQKNVIAETRHRFEKKEMGCVIATRVWSEGINIKSVDVVINAVGGNSELAAIQRFGRGMRITEDKNEVTLVDLIDSNSHKWFERHSMERICFYSERGWL